MDELHHHVASQIRKLARERRIRLTHLPDRAGVSRGAFWKLLAGKASPTLRWLAKLADALDVDVAELIGRNESRVRSSPRPPGLATEVKRAPQPVRGAKSSLQELHAQMAARIKRLLEQKDWPASRLAARSGISRAHLSGILSGKKLPTLPTLLRLAQSLDVEAKDLL